LVHESVAAEYIARLTAKAQQLPVGDPHREHVAVGPIINEKQLARISSIVDESVAGGAIIAAGGAARGPFFAPTVLHAVTPAMRVFRDEIFGPVAPITTFNTLDEAIELANDTEYGLSAAVYTSSISKGLEIADRIRSGMVHVNDQTVSDDPWGPFVGIGASGNGRGFGGPLNHESFTQTRWVTIQDDPAAYPF
jgi:benzaldehyde dehydrogenase (NAD)